MINRVESQWTVIIIYICGETDSYSNGNSDIFLIKYNASLTKIWNTSWGGTSQDYGKGIGIDSKGYIHVSGVTLSYGVKFEDVALLMFNSSGNLITNTTWGDANLNNGEKLAIDSSDNIYVCGWTIQYGTSDGDYDLIKFKISVITIPMTSGIIVPGFEFIPIILCVLLSLAWYFPIKLIKNKKFLKNLIIKKFD
ncbi:MAG: SBBP repeat-containing protein [Candidatus Helarchaeota archaeon]